MKAAVLAGKILLLVLAGFFVLMSFDVCDAGGCSVWEWTGGFLIHASPGWILILATVLLWKKEWILGILAIAGAVFLFFFFKFYRNLGENWITVLVVEVPMLGTGCLFLADRFLGSKRKPTGS